jgi:dTDP-4-amino-4,6-dideoxygalactose transaminase
VGLKNLGRIKELIHARHRLLSLYRENLNGLAGIRFQTIPGDRESTGNYMVIWVSEEESGISRDEVYRKLKREGIETKKYFYPAVHLQRAYEAYRNGYPGRLPITEKAAQEGLALPLYSHMEDSQVITVCEAIRFILRSARGA